MELVILGKRRRHIKVPEGYFVVKSPLVCEGDLVLDLYDERFHEALSDDLGMTGEHFSCVIRKQFPGSSYPDKVYVIDPEWEKNPKRKKR